jgi:hypothetical protein
MYTYCVAADRPQHASFFFLEKINPIGLALTMYRCANVNVPGDLSMYRGNRANCKQRLVNRGKMHILLSYH